MILLFKHWVTFHSFASKNSQFHIITTSYTKLLEKKKKNLVENMLEFYDVIQVPKVATSSIVISYENCLAQVLFLSLWNKCLFPLLVGLKGHPFIYCFCKRHFSIWKCLFCPTFSKFKSYWTWQWKFRTFFWSPEKPEPRQSPLYSVKAKHFTTTTSC